MRFLIENGADVNKQNRNGRTALFYGKHIDYVNEIIFLQRVGVNDAILF